MQTPMMIVGAGITGACIARHLADNDIPSHVFDINHFPGGLCADTVDIETGQRYHLSGPHIFHTSSDWVWDFVTRFAEWVPYKHSVMVKTDRGVMRLPMDLGFFNTLYGMALTSDDMETKIGADAFGFTNLPEVVERLIYEYYSEQQWNVPYTQFKEDIGAEALGRIRVGFEYNMDYFGDKYVALPKDGYTAFFNSMLNHPLITTHYGVTVTRDMVNTWLLTMPDTVVYYTGPADALFDDIRLPGVNHSFDLRIDSYEARQGCAVMNYATAPSKSGHRFGNLLRKTDYYELVPGNKPVGYVANDTDKLRQTGHLVQYEYSHSRTNDDKYRLDYPYRSKEGLDAHKRCADAALATGCNHIVLAGRGGGFQYMNMDKAIMEALACIRECLFGGTRLGRMPHVLPV